MANWFTNFMNGLANWAKSVVMDPLVDLWALAAKWVNMWVSKIAWTDYKSWNKAIDEAAEWIKNEMVSKVDPTSTAWAIWEWIPVWLANADAVVSLVELAKNVGKQWLKQLPKLLGKYQDAKDKRAQLQAAQEIREYVQNQAKTTHVTPSEAPAYQWWQAAKEAKEVQKTVNDIAKMSDKDFKKFMQNNESASMAWYEPSWWDYRLEDTWHSWDLWKTKDEVIKNILNRHSLDQEWTLTDAMQSVIRNDAIKNNKNYRKWIKKDIKNNYDEATYWTTRAKERASNLSAANAENASIKAGEDAYKHYWDSAIWF